MAIFIDLPRNYVRFGMRCFTALRLFMLKYPPSANPDTKDAPYIAKYTVIEKPDGKSWNA